MTKSIDIKRIIQPPVGCKVSPNPNFPGDLPWGSLVSQAEEASRAAPPQQEEDSPQEYALKYRAKRASKENERIIKSISNSDTLEPHFLLPSLFGIGEPILVDLNNDGSKDISPTALSGHVYAAHFYPGKVRYDVMLPNGVMLKDLDSIHVFSRIGEWLEW